MKKSRFHEIMQTGQVNGCRPKRSGQECSILGMTQILSCDSLTLTGCHLEQEAVHDTVEGCAIVLLSRLGNGVCQWLRLSSCSASTDRKFFMERDDPGPATWECPTTALAWHVTH
jgi:hypothetical protein